MPTVTITDDNFDQDVLGSERPVLVDFWATWCAPCRMVAPVLEEIADEFAETLTVAKVDVDKSPMVAQRYGIRSIPTLVLFEDGKPVQAVQGALPKPALLDFLQQSISTMAPPRIDVAALAQRLDAKEAIVIVDVRAESDYDRAHLPGAIHKAPSDLEALVTDGASEPIVLVDRSGVEAEALAKELSGGPREVVALQGGLLEWQGAGHPTFSTAEEKGA